jgi:aarF domain-containing kinase
MPVTVCAALFPERHRGYAYELPSDHEQLLYPASLSPKPLRQPAGPLVAALNQITEEIAIVLRGFYLVALFAPAILSAPLVFYYGLGREQWMQLLRWTLEQAGPAFIKWGQWASSRPDLFPKDVCTTLESLQSNAPAHSAAYSRRAVEAAFGRPLEEVFSVWEDAPLASGSIAQIHRARLSPGECSVECQCVRVTGLAICICTFSNGCGY